MKTDTTIFKYLDNVCFLTLKFIKINLFQVADKCPFLSFFFKIKI